MKKIFGKKLSEEEYWWQSIKERPVVESLNGEDDQINFKSVSINVRMPYEYMHFNHGGCPHVEWFYDRTIWLTHKRRSINNGKV